MARYSFKLVSKIGLSLSLAILSAGVRRARAAVSPEYKKLAASCEPLLAQMTPAEKELAGHLKAGRIDLATLRIWNQAAVTSGLVGGKLHFALMVDAFEWGNSLFFIQDDAA